MSGRERKPRTRWPGIQFLRRRHNRQYRALMRRLLRRGDIDAVDRPRPASAKWEVW